MLLQRFSLLHVVNATLPSVARFMLQPIQTVAEDVFRTKARCEN